MRNHSSDRTSCIIGRQESTLLSENAGYTLSGGKRSNLRRVAGVEFVRGFLQHTLPRGQQKIRDVAAGPVSRRR